MKLRKKVLSVILASCIIVSILSGCSENTEPTTTTTTAVTTTTGEVTTTGNDNNDETSEETIADDSADSQKETRDLGGKEITIGNWWSNSDDFEPKTSYDEALVMYRQQINADNNMNIKEIQLAGWGEMQEIVATSIVSGSPAADLFRLAPVWGMSLLAQGLCYPVSDVDSINLKDEKWNQQVIEAWTYGDKTYALANKTTYTGAGVYYNKRLFEEAGIDPMLPYDLQASGNWDWDAFTNLCDQLTRDTDNDGIKDTYAITTFSALATPTALYSNDAKLIGRNDDGTFYNAITEPQFLEAYSFVRSWNENGYMLPNPEGSSWDYFVSAFNEGKAAMRIAEPYVVSELNSNMKDDFGYVFFPYGPSNKSKTIKTSYGENIVVVPKTATLQDADDALFAFDLWTDPVPGYDSPDYWKISRYPLYSDDRAVDETLEMSTKDEYRTLGYDGAYVVLPGDGDGTLYWPVWDLDQTPQQIIEKVLTAWNSAIDKANALIESYN